MHLLLVGNHRSDRSGLIRRLLDAYPKELPVCGFMTEKLAPDESGRCPIYLHPYGIQRRYEKANLIGWCKDQRADPLPQTFERYAPRLEAVAKGGIAVLDELGVMESGAPRFQQAVFSLLETAPLVIAAVRDKDTPFLMRVRNDPNAKCFYVEAGREEECFRVLYPAFEAEVQRCLYQIRKV